MKTSRRRTASWLHVVLPAAVYKISRPRGVSVCAFVKSSVVFHSKKTHKSRVVFHGERIGVGVGVGVGVGREKWRKPRQEPYRGRQPGRKRLFLWSRNVFSATVSTVFRFITNRFVFHSAPVHLDVEDLDIKPCPPRPRRPRDTLHRPGSPTAVLPRAPSSDLLHRHSPSGWRTGHC